MPADPPGTEISLNVPSCASVYMFELNGLHYYETVDCSSGATGWGVTDQQVTDPLGCNGTTCPSDNIITPIFTTLAALFRDADAGDVATIAKRDAELEKAAHFFEKMSTDAFPGTDPAKRRRWKKEAAGFLQRGQGNDRDIDDRRKSVGTWINDNVDKLADDSPLDKLYWNLEMRELRRSLMTFGGKLLITEDRPVTMKTIGSEQLSNYIDVKDSTLVVDVDDARIQTGPERTPYVKIKRPGHPKEQSDRFAYFRLLIVELADATLLNIGQEIEEEPLDAYLSDIGLNLNQVTTAKFVDRHQHFHVIRFTQASEDFDYFVYSANSFRAREDIS